MKGAKDGFGGRMIEDFTLLRLDGRENAGYFKEAECAAYPDFAHRSRVRFGR